MRYEPTRLGPLLAAILLSAPSIGCDSRSSDALETVRSWTKTAELPSEATVVETTVEGNAFSREITVRFRSDERAIRTWLENSPGIETAQNVEKDGRTIYNIQDSEAETAEVRIDWDDNEVRLHAYWS